MVCTANDLVSWKDFPKGLRVLLLEQDSKSATEIKSKLEEMDYIVTIFYNEDEALSAISNNFEDFHVAIVEVTIGNSDGRFKFLETARHLPTIMASDMQNLSTMMKCISLGAVEFLQKPLSEDKLRNIWQHVVHKAFNAGGKNLSETPKAELEDVEPKNHLSVEIEENNQEVSAGSDKYPAPSTPQIKQGARLVDDGDCNDQTNFSTDKESMDQDVESKSVETTVISIPNEEDELANTSKDESNSFSCPPNKDEALDIVVDVGSLSKGNEVYKSYGNKSNRRRMKVDWTPELHKKFVKAVEQLGVDQAIPSRILELMKVDGLTRHNVASHLQKYRMQRRPHILPKDDERRWPNSRDSTQRSYYPLKPIMAYPPHHANHHSTRSGQFYPTWTPSTTYSAGVPMWGQPYNPTWQSTESWQWNPYPGMYADAWGHPVVPQPVGPYPSFPHVNADNWRNSYIVPQNLLDLHPSEEVIDKAVKEAISKPWLPLPLGLNPPSTDSVLSELSKQGISPIPDHPH